MIVNVVDRRIHGYRFNEVNAVVEAAWHNNSCDDSDYIEGRSGPDYDELEHVSLAAAIVWASSFADPVTLYIYDRDGGIYETERRITKLSRTVTAPILGPS